MSLFCFSIVCLFSVVLLLIVIAVGSFHQYDKTYLPSSETLKIDVQK